MATIPDNSAGYVLMHYGDGATQTHTARVHLAPFDPASLEFTDPGTGGGSTFIPTSVQAFLTILENSAVHFMPGPFSVSGYDIYHRAPGDLIPVFVTALGAMVPGNHGDEHRPAQSPANQLTLNFRTAGGHKARFVLLGVQNAPARKITDGGDPLMNGMPNVLVNGGGGYEAAVGHDGTSLTAFRSATSTLNRRLRRHYNLA